jgi:hypothetical protein
MSFSLCHARFHCRALSFGFAVRLFFAVRRASSLPCTWHCRAFFVSSHGKEFFAVRELTATDGCTAAAVFPVVNVGRVH